MKSTIKWSFDFGVKPFDIQSCFIIPADNTGFKIIIILIALNVLIWVANIVVWTIRLVR